MRKILHYSSMLATLCFLYTGVYSQTNIFGPGVGTRDWDDVSLWSLGHVPTVTEDVIIANGTLVQVNAGSRIVNSLTLQGGAANSLIELEGGATVTVLNILTIEAGTGTSTRVLALHQFTLNCGSIVMNTTASGAGSEISLDDGGVLNVTGSITMPNPSTDTRINFVGSGTLRIGGNFIGGDLTINGALPTVNYTSTDIQVVKGGVTYGNLIFSGGGRKTIAGGDITISSNLTGGVVTFTDGIVNGNGNKLIFDQVTATTGASDVSFFNGQVSKAGNLGFNFTFPIGVDQGGFTHYMPIDIQNVQADVVLPGFTAQYVRAAASSLGPLGPASGLVQVSGCEYWTLTAPPSNPATDIVLSWNANNPCNGNYINTAGIGDLRVAHFDGTMWDAAGGTATGDASSGSVTWTGVTTFSPFTFGSNTNLNALPVLLADVRAYQFNKGVKVDWANETEENVKSYSVERSSNAINFVSINEQDPKTNNGGRSNYSFFDANPGVMNYYRIRVIEVSGRITLSQILPVKIGTNATGVSIYPNPVTNHQFTMGLANIRKGRYTAELVNSVGQRIFIHVFDIQSDLQAESLNLPMHVAPGVYILKVVGDGFEENKKLILR